MTKKRRKTRPSTINDLVENFVFHHISHERITSSDNVRKELFRLLTYVKNRTVRNRRKFVPKPTVESLYKNIVKDLDTLILLTPTGKQRELLTEANVLIMYAKEE